MMTEAVAHSIICPTLIGREPQRAALIHHFRQAQSGHGQTLLLTGEAGIGKSRLVAELSNYAAQQGGQILSGRAFEMDSAIPCALLSDLLRVALTPQRAAAMMANLGQGGAEVAKLLPELTALLPATVAPDATEADKRRLFEASLQCCLSMLPPTAPALIIVEDVHWCDNTSLDFLLFLARKLTAHPILLVITYRDNEVNHALARLLAALDREHLAVELRLTPFTKPQTEAMVRAIFALSRPVQADFLDALYTLTEGNPFFIEEILKACVASGDIFRIGGQWGRKLLSEIQIPRTVQVAVHQRVKQLTQGAQALLKLAAVMGQRVEFTLLQQVSQHDEASLLVLLKELMAAQLIVEETADRFAFRHALSRQAVYFTLLARERRNLHRTIAEAIEQQSGSQTHLPELAYHFHTAETWAKSWDYGRRAGELAQRLYAPRAAVEHFSHALEAATHLPEQDLPDSHACGHLYRARGAAYETLGEFEAARADFEQALALARTHQDRQAEWQSLLDLGFLWTSRDFRLAGEQFQQALTVARTLNEPAQLAHSLNRLGNWYVNNEQPHLGQRYHSEALTLFQSLNDQAGLAATLDLLVGATHLSGEPLQSSHYYEQGIALFHQLNEQRGLTSCLTWLTFRGPVPINLLMPAATLPACIQAAEDALQLARAIQWRPGEAFAMIALGLALGTHGKYGHALPLLEEAIVLAQEIDHRWDTVGFIALGALYLDLGLPEKAQPLFEQARAIGLGHRILFSLRNSTALLGANHLAQGQSAQVAATLATAFGDDNAFPTANEAAPTLAQRLCWFVRAELALHEGRATEALQIADHLLASAGATSPTAATAVPRLLKLRGDALLVLQRQEEAEQAYGDALGAAIYQGIGSLVWRLHLALSRLCKERGDRHTAAEHVDHARSLVDGLAATLPTPTLQQEFLNRASAHFPTPPTLTPLRARKQSVGGLTAREYEIATLIQQGHSDREIAGALSLSKRTVGTHVSNILAKLNFTARAQVAGWVVAKERDQKTT